MTQGEGSKEPRGRAAEKMPSARTQEAEKPFTAIQGSGIEHLLILPTDTLLLNCGAYFH